MKHEILNLTGTELVYQHHASNRAHDVARASSARGYGIPPGEQASPYYGPVTRIPTGTSTHDDLPASVLEAIERAERASPGGQLRIRRLA